MTIDDLARAAATDARRKAAQQVDPMLMLRRLHGKHRSQKIASMLASVVVGVAALVGGVGLAVHKPSHNSVTTPVATPHPSLDARCRNAAITCLGGNRFRVALTVPVTMSLADNFGDFLPLSRNGLETYRTDVGQTGITVLEHASPQRDDSSWSRDPVAGNTAASMAAWLSTRPFLRGTRVNELTVGGRKAFRVSGNLRRDATLPAAKAGVGVVAPTFRNANVSMGVSRRLIGDYTLLDVPGAGVTVIWSWTLDHPRAVLAGNQAYIDTLSFGPG